ncbi:MAG: hypothetical protein ACK55I_31950, partial [bacterium]
HRTSACLDPQSGGLRGAGRAAHPPAGGRCRRPPGLGAAGGLGPRRDALTAGTTVRPRASAGGLHPPVSCRTRERRSARL